MSHLNSALKQSERAALCKYSAEKIDFNIWLKFKECIPKKTNALNVGQSRINVVLSAFNFFTSYVYVFLHVYVHN
jgi:hypothetical protein